MFNVQSLEHHQSPEKRQIDDKQRYSEMFKVYGRVFTLWKLSSVSRGFFFSPSEAGLQQWTLVIHKTLCL